MRKVMANTTPLIALSNIDQLELLHKLYPEFPSFS
jgi:predicted nucleic acid-binding protein